MPHQTIDDVLRRLPRPEVPPLEAPAYRGPAWETRPRVGLAVASMARHMTDEGWQLFQVLRAGGYTLAGHGIDSGYLGWRDLTCARKIVEVFDPGVVVVQDKREWEGLTAGGPGGFDKRERFRNVDHLSQRSDLFRLTILKDAHQQPEYHRAAAAEMGTHAWVVYYAPRIVAHLAPYVRPEHLVRTYHTVDADLVPAYSPANRWGCLLSGAVSGAYPLRRALVRDAALLPETDVLAHPGYHRNGPATPAFLRRLCRYRVAICTSSIYGYALRKVIEATACGCVVLTDLPADEVLPEIDGNLVRITPDFSPRRVAKILRTLCEEYDPERQADYARRALAFYDYRRMGARLADDIERLRRNYNTAATVAPQRADHAEDRSNPL